jgi:hypothetical protein
VTNSRFAGRLIALALGAASFAATPNNSVRDILEKAAREVVARTAVPIYVPGSLQSLDAAGNGGCAFATSNGDSFDIAVYGRVTEYGKTSPLPCEANNAALLAEIHGQSKPEPVVEKRRDVQGVVLRDGTPAWFIPVSCGESCAPATLYWQTSQASHWLQMRLPSTVSKSDQLRQLIGAVNSSELMPPER